MIFLISGRPLWQGLFNPSFLALIIFLVSVEVYPNSIPNATRKLPTIEVMARPQRNGQVEVGAIEYQVIIRGELRQKPGFSLRSPIVYAGRTGIADQVDGLKMHDRKGEVSLAILNDPVDAGGFPFYRHWRAERPLVTPITISYRMLSHSGKVTPGPQFDFYSHSSGISSGGMCLFLEPEGLGELQMKLKWDLKDLPAGSIAASTWGEGDVELTGRFEKLVQAYYMVGPLGRYSPANSSSSFHAYWLGTPAFDPEKEMAWTYQSFEYLRQFYKDPEKNSYRVFVRALPGTGGGTALQNSFMLGTTPGNGDPGKPGPRNTLTHEMDHQWIGALSGGGVGGATWFAEGLNVYYTRLLLLRSGLTPVEDYENDINQNVRDYFSNTYRNASEQELGKLGFSAGVGTGSAQRVPYLRGSMYFAEVDAQIRAASHGKRKLDDLILPLLERRRKGEKISANSLVEAIVRELGPDSRRQFDDVIVKGGTILPSTGAFGPCFQRTSARLQSGGKDMETWQWKRVRTLPDSVCREW